MSYPRVRPIDLGTMRKKRYHGHNTICEKLREIFNLTTDEEIKLRCRIAMTMAKKMHERLKAYKAGTEQPTMEDIVEDENEVEEDVA